MTRVYIIRSESKLSFSPAYPPERESEILNTKNESLRLSRRLSWAALCSGLKHALGLAPEDCIFSRTPEGKWLCDKAGISLSHSGDYACAAVSDAPVGVDIEQPSRRNLSPDVIGDLLARVGTEKEKRTYTRKEFYRLWTEKESIFKQTGGKIFSPQDIETSLFETETLELPDCTVSVCMSGHDKAEFFFVTGSGIVPADIV